jgi:hypothetical protein
VADTRLFNKLTQWSARVDVRAGVNMLHTWFQENQVTSMSLNPRHKEVNRIETFQA